MEAFRGLIRSMVMWPLGTWAQRGSHSPAKRQESPIRLGEQRRMRELSRYDVSNKV